MIESLENKSKSLELFKEMKRVNKKYQRYFNGVGLAFALGAAWITYMTYLNEQYHKESCQPTYFEGGEIESNKINHPTF